MLELPEWPEQLLICTISVFSHPGLLELHLCSDRILGLLRLYHEFVLRSVQISMLELSWKKGFVGKWHIFCLEFLSGV